VRDRDNLEKFRSKAYRDSYLHSRVRGFIAYQIHALREKLGLSQAQFAELTGKQQSTISRLENTEYGKVSVQTLLDIASATNVALVVKFASYPDFVAQTSNMSVSALQPRTIDESITEVAQPQQSNSVIRLIDVFAARRHARPARSYQPDPIPVSAQAFATEPARQRLEPKGSSILDEKSPSISYPPLPTQRQTATIASLSERPQELGAAWN
jgi:transcriptional regulator with XRE-family HTH domain